MCECARQAALGCLALRLVFRFRAASVCLQEQERLLRDKEKADARVAKEREKELARLEAERRKHFERVQKEQASAV